MPEDRKTQTDSAEGMTKYGNLGCGMCRSQNSSKTGDDTIQGRRYDKMTCNDCGHNWKQPA